MNDFTLFFEQQLGFIIKIRYTNRKDKESNRTNKLQ